MKNRQIHRLFYYFRHNLMTLNGLVIAVAAIIALSWVWGSLGMMERNYTLQRSLDRKTQELRLAQLETRNLELEQGYLRTEEYQELAVRDLLGKGSPGESVLVIANQTTSSSTPPTSSPTTTPAISTTPRPGNFEQWLDFLFPSDS